ncbi:MAG: XdhC family protein [Pseudomonadota bacterium]
MARTLSELDHPFDILSHALTLSAAGARYALVVVTGSTRGAVRSDGALMLVPETEGAVAGYVSNGCVDADLALQARQALNEKAPRRLRYGEGSPFIDIRLPCGGAIDVLVIPDPNPEIMANLSQSLAERRSADLSFCCVSGRMTLADGVVGPAGWRGETYLARYTPKLKLRIAGRGAEALALLRVARAGGFDVVMQSPDDGLLEQAETLGASETVKLKTPSSAPDISDDDWTAFALLFHDHDWEEALLAQALRGPAFYIGAMGSQHTHTRRLQDLGHLGFEYEDLRRIRGPIGMIRSMRDASLLAVSILAEIVSAHHYGAREERVAACA